MTRKLSSAFRPFAGTDPETGSIIIDIYISRTEEFYNRFDASPDYERDLSDEVSTYIRNSVEDMSPDERKKARISLYLEKDMYERECRDHRMVRALRGYFENRLDAEKRKYRHAMIKGRRMFLRGMIFLVICLVACSIFLRVTAKNDLNDALSQSFVIIGWVALWKPIEFYLYDRGDMAAGLKELETVCQMPIDVRPFDTFCGGFDPEN